MEDGKSFNDIYLNLRFRKSSDQSAYDGIGKTDENGNYIFEVEASNENLDLQNQIVLQNALLESKDNFLKYGVISNDHQHHKKDKNGNQITDYDNIIGEPVDVRTEGKSTIVVGKLYHSNPVAQKIIKMLQDGSTRVRASVGGIFPEVEPDAMSGGEKVTHVLWNDLALTATPVNNTVGHAEFMRSLEPQDFVKALCAGNGTDHAAFNGGRALMQENIKDTVLEAQNILSGFGNTEYNPDKEVICDLITEIEHGKINSQNGAVKFLRQFGYDTEESRQIVREIIEQGGLLMKSSFSNRIKELMKSLSKSDEEKDLYKSEDENDEGIENEKPGVKLGDEDDDDTINLDDDLEDDDDSDSDDEDADNDDEEGMTNKSRTCKKSMFADDDSEIVDATTILKSLNDDLNNLRNSVSDIGNAVVSLGEMVAKVSGEKLPSRAQYYVGKSLGAAGGGVPSERPTAADYSKVQDVLQKSVESGEISLVQSSMMNSEFQQAMKGKKLSATTYNFLAKKINGGK